MSSEAPFTIHVTREAAERVTRQQGRVFLWETRVGKTGVRDHTSLGSAPSHVSFDCYYARREVQICVAEGLELREVIIRARRWPFPGVRVYVDGKRWGWRGDAVSAPVG